MPNPFKLLAVLLTTPFAACAAVPAQLPLTAAVTETHAAQPFVIAANPLAARAGLDVLKRGGSAVDAAIAMQAMLSLVEPQSTSVAGGAFLTYFDGRTRKVSVYDGREVAPAQAVSTMFLDSAGHPLPFATAVLSGRATGVPGVLKMLALAHDEHGRLPWTRLFGDAERTADEGFTVSPRLARMIHGHEPENAAPEVIAYFSKPDGTLLGAGDRLVNKPYAEFLRRLAAQGLPAFYAGSTAARIVAKTREAPLAGTMTLADLAAYRAVEREPVCGPFNVYTLCSVPPPASGVGLIQLMELLDRTDIAARGPADPQSWFLFAEASRLMYADRDQYVGDSGFVSVPVAGMIDPVYVAGRARLIGASAGPPPVAGTPSRSGAVGADATIDPTGTSHFIVRDADGNVVSMTTTVESIFGTGRMVDGFFLNNQLTDFSFSPVDAQGRPVVNAVAPGKRPRSSMVPAILITRDGRFAGAIGSAGGNAILAYVAKSLVAAIDWNELMQQAIAEPNLVARGTSFNGEVTKFSPAILDALRARGIELQPGVGEDSGVQGVLIRDERVDGGYDPRREGVVLTLPER
jgi:gamma-glutamyltranspeptidase/glutathione hydrolase